MRFECWPMKRVRGTSRQKVQTGQRFSWLIKNTEDVVLNAHPKGVVHWSARGWRRLRPTYPCLGLTRLGPSS
jgi:hypothetical protein